MEGCISTLFITSKGLLYGIRCKDGSSAVYVPCTLFRKPLGKGTIVEFEGTPVEKGQFKEYTDPKITKVLHYVRPRESRYFCYNCGKSFMILRGCMRHANSNCQYRGYDHL